MRRTDLPPERKRSYVPRDCKVVYVSTPKAACTSMKWVVAGLAGDDLDRFGELVVGPGTTPAGIIHPRRFWQHTPTLHDLSDDELAEIDGARGWHVFAVVRHPASRLWSAWQEKLLLREPHMAGKLPAALVPPLPRTTADVVEAFRGFVAQLGEESARVVTDDPHFQPQHDLLAADRMPYTRVSTTTEIDRAMEDLQRQVTAYAVDVRTWFAGAARCLGRRRLPAHAGAGGRAPGRPAPADRSAGRRRRAAAAGEQRALRNRLRRARERA